MVDQVKKFYVREYDNFPFKKDSDELIREFNDLETALYERNWYSKRARMGEKYYVIDEPHVWIVASEELERKWREAKKNCGLIQS